MEGVDAQYINTCLYNPNDAPLCPIFRLGDIVKLSGFSFETIAEVVSLLHAECVKVIQRQEQKSI